MPLTVDAGVKIYRKFIPKCFRTLLHPVSPGKWLMLPGMLWILRTKMFTIFGFGRLHRLRVSEALEDKVTTRWPCLQHGRPNELKPSATYLKHKTLHHPVCIMEEGPAMVGGAAEEAIADEESRAESESDGSPPVLCHKRPSWFSKSLVQARPTTLSTPSLNPETLSLTRMQGNTVYLTIRLGNHLSVLTVSTTRRSLNASGDPQSSIVHHLGIE